MSHDPWQVFVEHYVTLSAQCGSVPWETLIHRALRLLAELGQAATTALLLSASGDAHPTCLHDASSKADLCALFSTHKTPWQRALHQARLQYLPPQDDSPGIWMLPITAQEADVQAALALVTDQERPPAPWLADAATLLAPLIYARPAASVVASSRQDLSPEALSPATFDTTSEASQLQAQLLTLHYLYEISAAFLTQLNTPDVMFILLRALTDVAQGALCTALYQQEEGMWRRVRTYAPQEGPSLQQDWKEGDPWNGEEMILDACERQRRVIKVDRELGTLPPFWNRIRALGGAQVVYFPLLLPDQNTVGIVSLVLREDNLLSAHEMALTRAIIQQCTAALSRIGLYESSRANEVRLRAILEASGDGIILVSPDLEIRYINTQVMRLLAMDPRTSLWEGKTLTEFVPVCGQESPALASWLINSAYSVDKQATQEPPIFETNHQRSLQVYRWPVAADAGHHLGSLFVLRDITERRALEEMRDDVLHMLVHDLRNPIATIQNALHLLQDPNLKDLAPNFLSIASSNTDRILELVNTILEIGRMESGRFDLHQRATSLRECLGQTEHLSIAHPDLALEIDLPDDLPEVWVDPAVIKRVFENLLTNALRYIPQQGARIRVAATSSEEALQVEVFNNGPPIPEEVRSRLFQKYTPGPDHSRGYGLGLAFCRLAIEAHSGKIWAENRADGGVSFFFTLPQAIP